jgi:hypothetical protein
MGGTATAIAFSLRTQELAQCWPVEKQMRLGLAWSTVVHRILFSLFTRGAVRWRSTITVDRIRFRPKVAHENTTQSFALILPSLCRTGRAIFYFGLNLI